MTTTLGEARKHVSLAVRELQRLEEALDEAVEQEKLIHLLRNWITDNTDADPMKIEREHMPL